MAIDLKYLKKLAKQLRSAGIKSYKCADFEMVLSDEQPVITRRAKRKAKSKDTQSEVDIIESDGWDSLTEEQKLYWSTNSEMESSNEIN